MSQWADAGIDAWLRDGGIVVTASDRAARALAAGYHRRRQLGGLKAWTAPRIQDWRSFALGAWAARTVDARLVLAPQQELALWMRIVSRDKLPATALEGPRRRVAALAMEAHELLATHAPRYLHPAARSGWYDDAAVFNVWLAGFDDACAAEGLLAASRVPLELTANLERAGSGAREPLLAAGFDRILPAQRRLFDAWGSWREAAPGAAAADIEYFRSPGTQAELAACALWCRKQLDANPGARLLVVTPDAASRRGEIERAFLAHLGSAQLFEFSLGVALRNISLANSAHRILKWLTGPIDESEVDWLIACGHSTQSSEETRALERFLRQLRRRERQRTRWPLDAFCRERSESAPLPAAWTARMQSAQSQLASAASRAQRPLEWAALAPQLLRVAGWPGGRALSSDEYQAGNRLRQAVDACGSLGFDGRRIRWQGFLSELAIALDETLFAPESRGAPVLIAGPAESAGLAADAVWVLGAAEDVWPAGGSSHPFLPIHVQREGAMPYATPQLDWELARAVASRLCASAPQVRFSYARQSEGSEARASRLVAQLAGEPVAPPAGLIEPPRPLAIAEPFADASRIPFPGAFVEGGASVLTAQSQCAFKAFATARLGARGWDSAEAGLTASLRGQLVHAVMAGLWSEPPRGVQTLDALRALADRAGFIAGHVDRAMGDRLPAEVRERMPRRYLELETSRLERLVGEWLDYELTRHPFTVERVEAKSEAAVGALLLSLRMDRVDRLNDGSLLVIDYKTGDVSPRKWETPRPDDVQLPLYATFGIEAEGKLGGLAFAKVRTGIGKREFAGRVFDADGTLIAGLSNRSSLVRNPLTDAQLEEWRESIEALAQDFVAGRAPVNPREYPNTCEHCGLQAVCRVREQQEILAGGAETDADEASDE